jgi:putative membrane protein
VISAMGRASVASLACALVVPPAFAHGVGLPLTPYEAWHHWSFDPLVYLPLLTAHWLYGRGVLRVWRQAGVGRVLPIWRVAAFLAGEVVVVIALVSPLDPLGETLLAAHMLQHVLLTAVAPPLLLLGLPARAWIWAAPQGWRRLATTGPVRVVAAGVEAMSRPLGAAAVATAVTWAWHVPALFEAALEIEWVHTLEHLAFFVSALMAWRGALSLHVAPLGAALAVLMVFMSGGMLGGLLTLARSPIYDWYGGRPYLWGLSPLEDQQIAGVLMWVVAGAIYLAAFAALAVRCVAPSGSGRPRIRNGAMRASTSSRSMK